MESGIISKLIQTVTGMTMPIHSLLAHSLLASIAKTTMMMVLIPTPMKTVGIKPFGTKVSRAKAYSSPNITMLTTTMMASRMAKIPTMTTMELSTSTKNCSVSGVKNNPHGTTTTTAS